MSTNVVLTVEVVLAPLGVTTKPLPKASVEDPHGTMLRSFHNSSDYATFAVSESRR